MQDAVNKRRKARQRKIRRRRLKITFFIFLIIALITLVIMCFTVFFPVKRINVTGSKLYTKTQIVKASNITTDDNLFVISQKDIEAKIRKTLPYVDNVKLKRVFPDAIILTVTDAKEYAFYNSGDEYNVLSENGYVLKKQGETPQNVFEIVTSGIEGTVGQKAIYKNSAEQELVGKIITELSNKKINIDKIDVSNILKITLSVDNRFTVIIGTDEYLSEKIAHLSGMIDSIADRSGKINLSMWTPKNSQGSFVENKN